MAERALINTLTNFAETDAAKDGWLSDLLDKSAQWTQDHQAEYATLLARQDQATGALKNLLAVELDNCAVSKRNLERVRLPYDAAEAKVKEKTEKAGPVLDRALEERALRLKEYREAEAETLDVYR